MSSEDENFIDDVVDSYLAPVPTTVFDQFGNVVFPSKNKVLRIENKNTLISIFYEKRKVENILFVNNVPMDHVSNFVFLYKFMGIENSGGATIAQSFLDESKAKLQDNYEQTERDFNKMYRKLNALENHKLIYYGARNEG